MNEELTSDVITGLERIAQKLDQVITRKTERALTESELQEILSAHRLTLVKLTAMENRLIYAESAMREMAKFLQIEVPAAGEVFLIEPKREITSIAGNPAGQEWADKIKQLSPDERERRMAAVDLLLGMPQDVNDVLESELWTLRELLQG